MILPHCLRATGAAALCAAAALALPSAASAATYTLAPVADSQVSSGNAGTNYGDDNFLDVHHGPFDTRRSYLRFDLAGLPAGEPLGAVALWLYSEGGVEGLAIDLHHVADDSWGESTLTWLNKPAYTTGALATAATLHQWMAWTLPADGLARLAADTDGQWSLLVKLQHEPAGGTATFFSRDATTFPAHLPSVPAPYLAVTTVPEASTWAMLAAGLGLLGWLRVRRRVG